jgi:hypothetical protein
MFLQLRNAISQVHLFKELLDIFVGDLLLLIFLVPLLLLSHNVLDYSLSDEVILDNFVLQLFSDDLDRLVLIEDVSDLETCDLLFSNNVKDLFDVLRAVKELRDDCSSLGT